MQERIREDKHCYVHLTSSLFGEPPVGPVRAARAKRSNTNSAILQKIV